MAKLDKKKLLDAFVKTSTPQELFLDVYELAKNIEDRVKQINVTVGEHAKNIKSDVDLVELIKSLIPEVKDGKTYSREELSDIIIPLIPKPEKGKDGSIITPEEVRNKLKELKGKERLSVYDLKDIEWLKGEKGQIQWSSAGFKVYTDSTLTGDGSFANPLSVVGGGSFTEIAVSGSVNGSNQTFTVTKTPTYLVIDGAFYKQLDSNGLTQWSIIGGTITTNITPNSSIYGF